MRSGVNFGRRKRRGAPPGPQPLASSEAKAALSCERRFPDRPLETTTAPASPPRIFWGVPAPRIGRYFLPPTRPVGRLGGANRLPPSGWRPTPRRAARGRPALGAHRCGVPVAIRCYVEENRSREIPWDTHEWRRAAALSWQCARVAADRQRLAGASGKAAKTRSDEGHPVERGYPTASPWPALSLTGHELDPVAAAWGRKLYPGMVLIDWFSGFCPREGSPCPSAV